MTALTSVVEESTDHVLSLFLKMTSQSGNRIRVLGFMRVWLPRWSVWSQEIRVTKERLRLQRKEGAGKGETTWEQHHCTGLSDLGEFAVEELQSMQGLESKGMWSCCCRL